MPAIQDIPKHFTDEFASNWHHNVQQKNKRLAEYGIMDSVNGERKRYNQMEAGSMSKITGRAESTVADDLDLKIRWLIPSHYQVTNLLDEWDEQLLGDVVLPSSPISKNHKMAYNRQCDKIFITALEGDAITGELGTTTTSMPASQTVAVNYVNSGAAANSGLTLAKLIEARSILGKNDVYDDQDPDEQLCAAVSQKQLDDLLFNVDQVDNSRYNDVKALVEGKVDYFMGFKFKRSEQLTLDAATDVRTAIFWCKSAIVMSSSRYGTKMSIRDDRNEALQIRTKCSLGASRMEEKKVVLAYCDESI